MLQERGLSYRNNKIYFTGTSARCSLKRNNNGKGLVFYDVVTAFFILIGGFGLSLASGVIERSLVMSGLGIVVLTCFKKHFRVRKNFPDTN
jgi:hypothetical protein